MDQAVDGGGGWDHQKGEEGRGGQQRRQGEGLQKRQGRRKSTKGNRNDKARQGPSTLLLRRSPKVEWVVDNVARAMLGACHCTAAKVLGILSDFRDNDDDGGRIHFDKFEDSDEKLADIWRKVMEARTEERQRWHREADADEGGDGRGGKCQG